MRMRRAVWMIRRAISPRLAIRSEAITTGSGQRSPGRLTLLKEGRDALLALVADTGAGDAAGGFVHDVAVEPVFVDELDQILRRGDRAGRAGHDLGGKPGLRRL